MRSLALYGCVVSLLIVVGCADTTVNPRNDLSLDGSIYYTVTDADGKSSSVCSINPDGTERKVLLDSAVLLSAPAAGRLAVLQGKGGAETRITVFDIAGGKPIVTLDRPLTRYLALSPAGDKLLYCKATVEMVPPFDMGWELHVTNIDGTSDIILEPLVVDGGIPAFSPDGMHVAFMKKGILAPNDEFIDSLFVINTDGTGRHLVTDYTVAGTKDLESLSWSPDGSKIVCMSGLWEGSRRPLVVQADGSGTQFIPLWPARVLLPVWSPDGKKLACATANDFGEAISRAGLLILNADGTGRQEWTVSTTSLVLFPQWSPDGSAVLVVELDADRPRDDFIFGALKIVDAGSGAVRTLDEKVYKGYWAEK